ncbi:CDP-alcohol phosphatidyltransferase family protein [Clostridium sp. WLY-B-L2]|uniref:CDP-alcohol phosphatidyltransferase family protein n=1 Tax=Clostridium aromativorans TaxID=2836848 RepID=A0ABS8N8Z6_9CLOT|nr:CDP-alcohol phosphatidyltransferase family protein [Clostridium aromativorans]MCC9296275.1 CDP-alcohol phosphatidyltransferase family protein [Clostridium aromativorans]
MKAIANYISFSRIILSLILVFVGGLNTAFYAIYIICGFSDIIDGVIARKTKTTQKITESLRIDNKTKLIIKNMKRK